MGVGGVYARDSARPGVRRRPGDGVDGPARRCGQSGFSRDLRDAPDGRDRGSRALAIFATRSFGTPLESDSPPSERSRWPLPAPAEPIDSWSRVDRELRAAVPEAAYRIYLEPLRPIELEGRVLRVAAPASRHRWVIDRFGRVLQTCAAAALGPDIEVMSFRPTPPAGRTSHTSPRPPSATSR